MSWEVGALWEVHRKDATPEKERKEREDLGLAPFPLRPFLWRRVLAVRTSRRATVCQPPQSAFFTEKAAGVGAGSTVSSFFMAMTPPRGSLTMSETTVFVTL